MRVNGEVGGNNRIDNPKHGTAKMYQTCKCIECKNWKRLYRNGVVDSRGNAL